MVAPLPGVPASHGFKNFKYEPLDLSSNNPSIRLAVLHPAGISSAIRITLATAAFADRPRYEALSYTWGRPDVLKGVELNGIRVDIRENLWDALVNLRDAREDRVLWIDAICINQADVEERNRQVELMAYIFGRAKKVIVWLGKLPVNGSFPDDLDTQVKTIALCSCPYWYRVWIVQEISSAMDLEVRWKESIFANFTGGVNKCETWDVFFHRVRESAVPKTQATTLAGQREGRHGDSYLLANLMEACKDSLCEEPRDKVYGFVGIAHDCQDGSLPVDYGKSLFELYEDVVRFQYRSYRSTNFKPKTIVHFSQLVQQLLGGHDHMLKDLAGRPNPLSPIQSVKHDPFKVTSVYSGKISILGPTYEEILGVPDASRRWKVALSKTRTDIEKLRKKNEGFMRLLIELSASDLEKACPIEPQYSWKREKSMREALGERDASNKKRGALTRSEWELIPMYKLGPNPLYNMPESKAASETPVVPFQSRLFATDDGLIGLVPHNAQKGDLIFQFLDSDVVAVVSLDGEHHMRIIGRAVIANDEYISGSKFCVPRDLHKNLQHLERVALDFENGVDVYMDIRTLQLMTR